MAVARPPILSLSSNSVVPLYTPPSSCLPHSTGRPSAPVALSRWNPDPTAAPPAVRRRRRIAELESARRRERRFDCALKVSCPPHSPPPPIPTLHFKSSGSPSSPSAPSLPGRRSKYSKPDCRTPDRHPAVRRSRDSNPTVLPAGVSADVRVGENGVSYYVEGAPFEFQYSYTETPKVKPLKLREAAYLPFGPETMPRPWTGRKPLPGTKKLLPEFDSFVPPPPGKKGVKPVQAPGPFLVGAGPRYHAKSREEVMGEPLSKEEVEELVKGSLRVRRQLNMGRDGLTHNMLENIHAHWKRRRVCKIKCLGVCTVDLDNVCQQLEEKVGGKVIHRQGGVIFLFRGRNYNYKTRPKFPLMLWKPASPLYPRLIKQAPEGLTLEEAKEMRKRGRQLPPICRLAKNGLFDKLVPQVQEAFEVCDLARIDCKGLNKSDCRKVGAKLKDLVPCVLISFEFEHILMWRGKDWKSSLEPLNYNTIAFDNAKASDRVSEAAVLNARGPDLGPQTGSTEELCHSTLQADIAKYDDCLNGAVEKAEPRDPSVTTAKIFNDSKLLDEMGTSNLWEDSAKLSSELLDEMYPSNKTGPPMQRVNHKDEGAAVKQCQMPSADPVTDAMNDFADKENRQKEVETDLGSVRKVGSRTDGLLLLLKQAVESNIAVVLDESTTDADTVFQNAVALAKKAPRSVAFQDATKITKKAASLQKLGVELEPEVQEDLDSADREGVSLGLEKRSERKKVLRRDRRDDLPEILPGLVPQGTLRVDELAKLLS